jgi:hypothetical protein
MAIYRKQETIACAAFGVDHTFVASSVQLPAETADIDVQIVEPVLRVASPNAPEQMSACDQFSGMAGEYIVSGRELPLEALSLGNCDDLFE